MLYYICFQPRSILFVKYKIIFKYKRNKCIFFFFYKTMIYLKKIGGPEVKNLKN